MMQYTRLAKAVSLTLPLILLAGCDEVFDDNVDEVTLQSQTLKFDPSNGVIPYPNDIVGFDEDGTLKVPGETDWANTEGDSPNVYWNFYGAQKGWGTSVPMILEFTKAPEEAGGSPTIDPASFQNSIKMFKEVDGVLESLEWNKDYRAILAKAGTINIEPLKPFEENTRYFLALTNGLKDSHGQTLQASSAYRQLLSSNDEMGLHLQEVIDKLDSAGLSSDSIVYGADFTTGGNLSIIRPVVTEYLDEYSSDTKITDLVEVPVPSPMKDEKKNFILQEVETALAKNDVVMPELAADEVIFRTFTAKINLPNYMDTPRSVGPNSNCSYNPYVDSLAGSEPANFNEYRVAPQEFCPGAYSFWQTGAAAGEPSGIPVTAENASDIYVFKEPENNLLNLVIYLPMDPPENGNSYPVFMNSHGYGGTKEDATLSAKTLTAKGYAVVSLDHPMHGERAVDVDLDGTVDLTAEERRTDYVSPENLMTTRGFMWQTLIDYVGIRMALSKGVSIPGGSDTLSTDNVHMMGGSLGGITGTSISSLMRDSQEENPDYSDQLNLKTTSVSVPGGGVASILMQSPLLLEEMKQDILDAASFRLFMAEKLGFYNPRVNLSKDDKVTALDEVDEYRESLDGENISQPELIENEMVRARANKILSTSKAMGFTADEAPSEFAEFEEQVWSEYQRPSEIVYQSTIDPSDPINFAKVLAKYRDEPIFLNEAVGDGSNDLSLLDMGLALMTDGNEWNPGDFVIINQADEMPLGGTDPLIRALELDILQGGATTGDADNPIRGAARYGYGTHMSSWVPLPLAIIDKDLLPNDTSVHNSIVNGIMTMAESNGTEITIKNYGTTNGDSLLLPESEFPTQPEYKLR
ncbi:hypothetical protein [Endozoicomonas numazuensis]|uniref:Bacterial virulence factor lipase N-terminal domain-containing protein n=1 Tax=Endozoicomonas numazuensis TaxID=1137799 RepID=A0A081NE67_9GAMM|nr:hypothetical protein [Endozoicomonas numazuensis]KEQ16740.1 hypothetical protein GZ78_18785 [Endozoicomonas numazuensis]